MGPKGMGLLEDQNTGHIEEREEVARGQEVAILLGTRAGNTVRCVELDPGLC